MDKRWAAKLLLIFLLLWTGLNFINVLRTAFTLADSKCKQKDSQVGSVVWRFWDLQAYELYVKRWWNWALEKKN